MSGGSFNYLCDAVICERRSDLLAMAGELRALGYHDIARETESFAAEPTEALRKVWKAVEWWRSCDWGKDQAAEVAAAYERLFPVKAAYDRDGFECRCGRFHSGTALTRRVS